MCLDARGRLYICDPANHQVWRVSDDGNYEAFGDAIDFPNFPAFGPDGALYVSDSGSFDTPSGQLFRIDPDGTTTSVASRPLHYANGLCASADTLYIIESSARQVSSFDFTTGSLETHFTLERCNPDGLALDADGGLPCLVLPTQPALAMDGR